MMKRLIRVFSLAIALCMILTFAASAEIASPIYSAGDLFTSRDYEQTADLSGAVSYTVSDGQDIHISAAGVYVLTGSM